MSDAVNLDHRATLSRRK